jgi:hypothetical protein
MVNTGNNNNGQDSNPNN